MTEKMSDEEFRILNGVLRYDYGVTETQTAPVKSAFAPPASGSSIIAQESPADAEPYTEMGRCQPRPLGQLYRPTILTLANPPRGHANNFCTGSFQHSAPTCAVLHLGSL
jgi:hypothetical protein